MTGESETKSNIAHFLYHISQDNYSNANKVLGDIVKNKVNERFNDAYEKVAQEFKAKSNK